LIVDKMEEMAEAIAAIDAIDPRLCRQEARRRFTRSRMVGEYFRIYEQLAKLRSEGVSAAESRI
jgi:hypothetical protein